MFQITISIDQANQIVKKHFEEKNTTVVAVHEVSGNRFRWAVALGAVVLPTHRL